MHSSVVLVTHDAGKPSPASMVDWAKHARKPSNSTALAIPDTCCPPASAKHVT